MNQELSNEEIARVFAMYQGQNVLCYPSDDGIGYDEPTKLNWSVIAGTHYSVTNTILSLRRLSDITDEHALGATKLHHPPILGVLRVVIEGLIIKVYRTFKHINNSPDEYVLSFSLKYLSHFASQYLIEKDYAVPLFFGVNHWANGKTAIELGIAIPKTI